MLDHSISNSLGGNEGTGQIDVNETTELLNVVAFGRDVGARERKNRVRKQGRRDWGAKTHSAIPAELTRMSILPNSLVTSSTAPWTLRWFLTSICLKTTGMPNFFDRDSEASSPCSLRTSRMTRAFKSTSQNASAMLNPRPRAPLFFFWGHTVSQPIGENHLQLTEKPYPVTTAILFERVNLSKVGVTFLESRGGCCKVSTMLERPVSAAEMLAGAGSAAMEAFSRRLGAVEKVARARIPATGVRLRGTKALVRAWMDLLASILTVIISRDTS
jgi:hypothetical protein